MWFAALMFITTLAIAACAGYISVIGFANTFSATFWAALALATSLEFGKLVAASFLYRYWKSAQFLLKSVMVFSVAGLMLFTSAGIYGYLTSSYQTSTLSLDTTTEQVALLEEERTRSVARKNEIDAQITALPTNYVTSRRQLMDTFGAELEQLNARIPVIDQELLKLKTATIQEEAHVGPIVFVAETFGVDANKAMNYFVLLVVLVFDPLAVAMTLATNHVIMQVRLQREQKRPPTIVVDQPTAPPPTTQVVEVPSAPIQTPTPAALPTESSTLERLTQLVGSLDTSLKKMEARRTVTESVRTNSLS